ncbi:hypothetical protein QBC38DRAFT_530439 [Podospora fimiseda]|uniref:FAD-binding domain-containing protein n=1 Tax=Podospora fimiseda TaxID=252190 RepID=A0AAN7BLL7_9PEZI|nr:hypothetical protein QBC38DRAFT_530439 [Podospora fimiseda]
MAKANFKVIVIGGGPVGLTAAQALTKAGIDFLVLERRDTCTPEEGSGIAIGPTSYRLFDQLDLLDVFAKVGTPINTKKVLSRQGQVYNDYELHFKECHGRPIAFMSRIDLLKSLYETLPDSAKAKILTNKNITSVESLDQGVRVTCEDGSVHEGSVVWGADGVHSKTRKLMDEMAFIEHNPFPTAFQGMFGNIPRSAIPGTPAPGTDWESHGSVISSQFFTGEKLVWFIIYKRLPKPTTERVTFTQQDVDAFAEEIKDLHLTNQVKFGEVYPKRNFAGLLHLQEGIAPKRNFKRIALLGDAAAKITPNLGFGYNSGVLDVIQLTNQTKEMLAAEDDLEVSSQTIEKVFEEYAEDRKEYTQRIQDSAHRVVRTVTWGNSIRWVLDRYVYPFFGTEKWFAATLIGPVVAKQPVLNWVREKQFVSGSIPWKMRVEGEKV